MDYNRAYFSGKVAAVTGGASGIGLALCEELLESGAAKVVLADFNRDNLSAHEKRLSAQYPGKVMGVLCNVTVEDEVKKMVADAADFGGGRLDLLINCAGAALAGRFVEEAKLPEPDNEFYASLSKVADNEAWEKGFALNFYGALYGCWAALPIMLRQKSGQIVNIISGIAFSPMAYQSMYAVTKSALNAMTLALRAEYGNCGIKFNSATPGTTATAIFGSSTPPPEAQSPHQSAERILNGAARDVRIILGDDSDASGGKYCFYPDSAAVALDNFYLSVARQRSSGLLSYGLDGSEPEQQFTAEEQENRDALLGMPIIDPPDFNLFLSKIDEYLQSRNPTDIDRAYFRGKTALVTGAASGIGLALCETLLECGAKKIVMDDINGENLSLHAQRLSGEYEGRVKAVLCDVSDEKAVKAMIAEAAEFFDGSFDILINCAGIGHMGMFSEIPDGGDVKERMGVLDMKQLEGVFAVNFYGPLYGCRAVLPIMIAQGHGQIVNIISGTGMLPMPYQSAYSSSKAALNALSLVLRYEYWDQGVKINSATPGIVATAIFGAAGVPKGAQSPRQSALRILTGVDRNERLIYGDDGDGRGAFICCNEDYGADLDELFSKIARARRGGSLSDYGD